MLPPDAGLDKTAISYHKGCYIGQEVLSRIKSAGKLNRRLAAFCVHGTASAGNHLNFESREVGHLTSCSYPAEFNAPYEALGFLKKQGFEHTEFQLTDSTGKTTGTASFVGWA
jgi:folate-binding Fe-S cluster repair protein YgfZ